MKLFAILIRPVCFSLLLGLGASASAQEKQVEVLRTGDQPKAEDGRVLNFGFETGTLADWTVEGAAFADQPIQGDTVHARRGDMHSRHAGDFWIGGYERHLDQPQGTLTSVPFVVSHPFASFLVAGGSQPTTCVELVRKDNEQVIFRASGDVSEELQAVAVDLRDHMQREIFIRLVDRDGGGWGHLNFDDFLFHEAKPTFPTRPIPPKLDTFAHAGLLPQESAAAMTVPDGFTVTLFAGEPDVHQPIGMALDDRGRLWVAEAYSYPVHVPADQARDRILIFTDQDGDGRFDNRQVFADKLNLVSAIEIGFGGVWVGAAPNLLFIPDRDGDDKPDGPPEVVLDGWGFHDTHETLNAFIWGPDGWLYGCHGVFTHSLVGKPGTPESERVPLNAGIWRYHPTRKTFEVFAHGTSNPWGVDFNDQGQAFLTACVIPHLYHVIQGARYERQAGPHFNPFTYDDIKTIAVHRHWVGANPHAGNNHSDEAGGGHAHAGAMIYLGGAWPAKYRNQIFMNNIHGARINQDQLTAKGSGFEGNRAPDFLLANDAWSQILNMRYGPDGQVYMIDWYDRNQCHHHDVAGHDRGNGRIFKVSHGVVADADRPESVDLKKLSSKQLVQLLLEPNDWYVRHARRLLQERGPDPAIQADLEAIAFDHDDETRRLRGLWALHVMGGLKEKQIAKGRTDKSPWMRGWTIQLALEGSSASPELVSALVELARHDRSPVVRRYLASAAGRLPLADRWDLVAALGQHAEDAADHNLPLLYWYAAEPLAEADPARALQLAAAARVPPMLAYMTRRVAALDTPESLKEIIRVLALVKKASQRQTMLREINEAFKGQRKVAMPSNWPELFQVLSTDSDAVVRSQATALALTFGDPAALAILREVLVDSKLEVAQRQAALTALVKAKAKDLAPVLQSLVPEPAMRGAAVRGLAAYDDARTPQVLIRGYANFQPAERRDVLGTLSARVEYSKQLLAAAAEGKIPLADLSADVIRQMRGFDDLELNAQIEQSWGDVRDTPAEKQALIAELKQRLSQPDQPLADLALGRAVFAKTCQQCHTLFGTGSKVGPEITGANRGDLDYILSNIVDPSALIGKDYRATVINTTDGRGLTGIIRQEDQKSLTLVTATETVTVPLDEIDERALSDKSMMPDDILRPLSETEIRALVAYLASPSQVPMLATPDNVATLFNGVDLTGWTGKPELWSVENGEIVGRTDGLARNEFLRSDLLLGDFHLKVQVKLLNNEGNSGIQFRSEAVEEEEVKGYQADIGAGWWGKLYEEHGRGLIWEPSGEQHVRAGEWNTYEVIATGDHVRTLINGQPCVDLHDPTGARRGILAFQLHSGGATEVRFKALELSLQPAAAETE